MNIYNIPLTSTDEEKLHTFVLTVTKKDVNDGGELINEVIKYVTKLVKE